MTSAALCISTFLGTLLGSFLPVGSTELIVLSAATLAPTRLLIPLALIAALAQMIAKSFVYLASRGLVNLPRGRFANGAQDLVARAGRLRSTGSVFLLASAATGFPPFYLTTVAAGTLRIPFARFFVVGLCGRVLRFTVLVGLPHALKSAL